MVEQHTYHWSESITGTRKLIISVIAGSVGYALMGLTEMKTGNRFILSWDLFCISMLVFNWILFFTTSPQDLPLVVDKQDDGVKVIFIIVTIAVCFSVFGAIVLMFENRDSSKNKVLHTIISLSPVLISWLLLHTMFTIRYAHLYHDNPTLNNDRRVGGIDFPANEEPDYLDFAYFSFVIGMTFQVSDTTVSSRRIRRFTLMHSLISFVFNTIIVALTINTLAGIRN